MILFTHYNFYNCPVIEFENYDGKFLQIISHTTKPGFGPFKIDIKLITDDPNKMVVELIPEHTPSDEIIGLFYSQTTFSHRCLDESFILSEWLGKIIIPNRYQPRVGFYKLGAKIEARYLNHSNLISNYVWDLTPDGGWVSTHPTRQTKLKYT
jgi:hypothetical protein